MSYYEMALKINFIKPVSIQEISEEGVLFSDGSLLTHHHMQDCCEHVYADWQYLREESPSRIKEIRAFEVFEVPNTGIRIVFLNGDYEEHASFVPCYNSQNGYYNSNLEIVLLGGNVKIGADVSKACFQDIH